MSYVPMTPLALQIQQMYSIPFINNSVCETPGSLSREKLNSSLWAWTKKMQTEWTLLLLPFCFHKKDLSSSLTLGVKHSNKHTHTYSIWSHKTVTWISQVICYWWATDHVALHCSDCIYRRLPSITACVPVAFLSGQVVPGQVLLVNSRCYWEM